MECATWALTVITFFMVIAAFQSVRATKKSVHGQFFFNILESYSSEPMYDAINLLIEWKDKNTFKIDENDDFFATWFEHTKHENPNEYKKIDQARRRVSQHFTNIFTYQELGFLNENEVKKLATKEQIDDLLIKVVKPLEKTISGDEDDPAFQFFENLHK